MEWLSNFIKNNPFHALLYPVGLGSFSFFMNILAALSDGQIDGDEFHQLLSSSSGLQTVLLIVIMFSLKSNNKNKKKGK